MEQNKESGAPVAKTDVLFDLWWEAQAVHSMITEYSPPGIVPINRDSGAIRGLGRAVEAAREICNENTASQSKVASIADYAEFRKMCNVIAGGNLPDGAFFWLCIYLDSKLRAPADQAASVATNFADPDSKCAYHVCDEADTHDPACTDWIAAPQQSLAPAADLDELHFNAQRLRNVAALVGVPVDGDDAYVDGVRGALLGQIAFALRKAAAEGQVSTAAPADSIGEVTAMPGTSGFTMAVFKATDVPVGTKLFRASEGQAQTSAAPFDFHAHLARQAAWSNKTFGPGPRTLGVCDHIRKELNEIEADPLDLKEWVDVVILALDGAWRCGGTPEQIIDGIVAKQTKNEGRVWPDWRTMDPNKAIEHDRSHDAAQSADEPAKD